MNNRRTARKKDHICYGLITMLIWNILVITAYLIVSNIKQRSIAAELNENGYMLLLFPISWSIMWYFVGYQMRKEYVAEKTYFRKFALDMPNRVYQKAFNQYYSAKYCKMLGIVSLIGIPLYLLYPLREGINDYVIAACVACTALFYGLYFKNRHHALVDKIKK